MCKQKEIHICKQCGNEFMGWSGNPNKYCGRECKNKSDLKDYGCIKCASCGGDLSHDQKKKYTINKRYYAKKGKNYGNPYCSSDCAGRGRRVEKLDRTCKRCGNKFKARKWSVENHNRGHYCSKECSTKQQAEDRSQECRMITECEVCGKNFSALKKYLDQGLRRYCSDKCRHIGRRSRVVVKCDNCGKKFEKITSREKDARGGEKDFCSKECHYNHSWYYRKKRVKRTCGECGKAFTTNEHRIKFGGGKYCSSDCVSRSQRIRKTCLTPSEHYRVQVKFKGIKDRRGLTDYYIGRLTMRGTSLHSYKDIPEQLIELKRLIIKRKRKLKEITHGNSQ